MPHIRKGVGVAGDGLQVRVLLRVVDDHLLPRPPVLAEYLADAVHIPPRGLCGLGELKRRVDSGEMKMALALYPVSMQQIMNIADSGNIMPPKATWFEPKLRSGLVIHKLI